MRKSLKVLNTYQCSKLSDVTIFSKFPLLSGGGGRIDSRLKEFEVCHKIRNWLM